MSTRTIPRLWPFFLTFVVLLIFWVLALEMFMKPAALRPSATPMRRLLWWLVPPLAVILGFFAIQWGRKEYKAQAETQDFAG